jgi:CubicO group peptidase (beta-lactamase class C family)
MEDSVQLELEHALTFGLDGVIVCSIDADGGVSKFAAGLNNRADEIPAAPNDLFKIASIAKMYVALAAVRLAQQGVVSLDSSIQYYLPELSNQSLYLDQITLQDLIRHRSGLPNYTDHPDFPWEEPPGTFEEHLPYIFSQEQEFKAGEDSSYSNSNYLFLAEALNRSLGYSHTNYLKDSILIPAGLVHTYGSMHEVEMSQLMSGYFVGYPLDIKSHYFGSMVATAEDVAWFVKGLSEGKWLDQQGQRIYSKLYRFNHSGLLPGYQSWATYDQKTKRTVVQFVNTNGGYAWNIHTILYRRVCKMLSQEL